MTFAMRRSFFMVAMALVLATSFATLPGTRSAGAASGDGSGGKAIAHREGSAVDDSAAARRSAPDPKLHRINIEGAPLNAGEPTLGLTKNGDVFYTAIQSNLRIEVAHSADDGQTWDLRSPKIGGTRNAHLLTFDPYIYVDTDTDRIFNIDLTVACSYLSFSDDKGKSWTTNALACGRPVNDHHTLFAGPPAITPTPVYENIVYYCWNDVGSSSCSKSLDGGLSFSPTGTPAYPGVDPEAGDQGDSFCGGLHAHGHVGHDGTVYLPKGHCGQPWLAISKDEGATWTRVQVSKLGTSTHEAGVATDKKGNIYYTWMARDRRPYLAISKDGGKSWGKPMMIAPPGLKEGNLPGLDVGDPGKIAVVYMGSENSPFKPNGNWESPECTLVEDQLGQCGDPRYKNTTWNGYMTISDNALDDDPLFYTATVNDKKDPLVRTTCGPGRCHAVYDFIDIVIGPDGTAWGAFVDACIMACADPKADGNAGAEAIVGHLVGGPKLR
ncbi:MAG TPA: sialidase family protein [Actinomycetota bacterium]|nr:sialidase family protein [Actinomycetota bacterium]